MGKGFDEFMKNPYYREQYENAPTERLKRSFELSWDRDYLTREEREEYRNLRLSREEVEYLAQFAVGGYKKWFFKKWLSQLD